MRAQRSSVESHLESSPSCSIAARHSLELPLNRARRRFLGRAKTERFERVIQELTALREQREAPARPPPPRVVPRRAEPRDLDAEEEKLSEEAKDKQLSTKIAKGIITGAIPYTYGGPESDKLGRRA